MKKTILAAIAATLVATAAQPALADGRAGAFVRAHAVDLLEGALTDQQVTTLQLVAHQAAIAAACADFRIDDAKFTAAFGKLAPEGESSAEQTAYHQQHVQVIYGILLGGELAAISDDIPGACADAAETRADADLADSLIWQ